MRRSTAAVLLALALVLAACGDDDSETPATEPAPATGTEPATATGAETAPPAGTEKAPATETETETEAEPPGPGPEGELSPLGVGEVRQGMSIAQVRKLFGAPKRQDIGPGCELAPKSPKVLTWTYRLEDGRLFLRFDAASGKLGSYRNTSPSLVTIGGDRVGDPFSSLRANWASSLKPVNLGAKSTPQLGFWWIKQGPRAELLFDIVDGRIDSISGGEIQFCE